MSLVGTRPPTVDEYEQYEFVHRKRLAVKPGITGMWQVSGRSRITDFDKVVALDAAYIEQWDITLDRNIYDLMVFSFLPSITNSGYSEKFKVVTEHILL